jgi:CRP-like cAMP-binding protein
VLSYQDFGLELLFRHMEAQGVSAQEAMRLPVVQSAFAELQRRLSIVPDEHDELIGRYLDVDGAMVRRCQQSLEELHDLVAAARALSGLEKDNPFVAPLRRDLAEQNAQKTTQLLNRLAAIESPAAQATMARSLAAINGGVVSAIVERSDSAARSLGNSTLAILRGAGSPVSGEAAGVGASLVREDLEWRGKDASSVLVEIASCADTPLNAFALRALAISDNVKALEIARRLEDSGEHLHWLLEEAVRLILGRSEPTIKPHAHEDVALTLELVDTATKALWILSTPFLARSPTRSVIDLARDMEVRSYEHGAVLCRRGDASNEIYIVREGILHAFVDSAGERKSLHYIQSGDVVGELGVVTGSTRSCSVDVDSDRATVMAIDHRTFNDLLSHDALLSTSILRIVAERLIDRTYAVG